VQLLQVEVELQLALKVHVPLFTVKPWTHIVQMELVPWTHGHEGAAWHKVPTIKKPGRQLEQTKLFVQPLQPDGQVIQVLVFESLYRRFPQDKQFEGSLGSQIGQALKQSVQVCVPDC
jgi:hypothetical protein